VRADPGPVLAQGRASIIYDLRDGTVLRRYVGSDRSAEPEADVMRLAAEAGVSVTVVHSASGPDIRMDLVPGSTMLADLADHPGRARRHGRVLAHLHASLDHVRPRDGSDQRLVHGDLHPGNVVLGERGPVLLDWTNHRFAYRALDLALSWLILACFEPAPADTPAPSGTVRSALRWLSRCGGPVGGGRGPRRCRDDPPRRSRHQRGRARPDRAPARGPATPYGLTRTPVSLTSTSRHHRHQQTRRRADRLQAAGCRPRRGRRPSPPAWRGPGRR